MVAVAALAVGALCPPQAEAQLPGRFYWHTLSGSKAVPVIYNSISGNTNPFDPAHVVTPGANFDGEVLTTGYVRTFDIWDRSAMGLIVLPMGRVSGEVTAGGRTINQSASGFGDPMVEFTLNLIGPKAQKNIPDVMRYQPGFTLDVLGDLFIPIGEYNSDQPLNIGQNRWYGRVGFPVIWQLGDWVPGRRTTLEFLPAVWWFGNNTDYLGQTLKTDPLYQLDAHLTRDLTETLWGALDASWYYGGRASINGVQGAKLNNVGVGLTLGYSINSNLNLTLGYKSTIGDSAPSDLRMDGFMLTLVYGWHPLIEGSKRLRGGEK
jgi:hypothetical protein